MDPYQSADNQSDAVIDAIIERLEARGENARFRDFIGDYLGEIGWDGVSVVVDLGCGTGVVTRMVAERAGPAVRVVGVDLSEKLLEAARRLSTDARIEWCRASADALPMADGTADVVILHTLLSHVPDPAAVLAEVRRVLKPGGRAVIFDADYASTTFAAEDWKRGMEVDLKLFAAVVANLDVCRRMPGLIVGAGLNLDSHRAHVIAEAGHGDFWLSSVRGFEKLIPALGIMPDAEGRAWVAEMLAKHEAGTFFAAGNYYTFHASFS
jgi:SAM-dependent methyltransferase